MNSIQLTHACGCTLKLTEVRDGYMVEELHIEDGLISSSLGSCCKEHGINLCVGAIISPMCVEHLKQCCNVIS